MMDVRRMSVPHLHIWKGAEGGEESHRLPGAGRTTQHLDRGLEAGSYWDNKL
jgi:hypothetical protein